MIESVLGQFGGYHIREPADTISLYDVIQVTEPQKINGCLESGDGCSRNSTGDCSVRQFYEIMQEQWDKSLKKHDVEGADGKYGSRMFAVCSEKKRAA